MQSRHSHIAHGQRWALGLAAAVSFMVSLDSQVVATALPVIRVQLHASLAALEWTVNAYTLSFAVLLLTGAALGERLGRRRMLAVGVGLFAYALVADPGRRIDLHEHAPLKSLAIRLLARTGLAARGAVVGVIGVFLTLAAVRRNPRVAGGPADSILRLKFIPYGPILLGTIAGGLIAYAAYLFLEAWYWRPPE